MKYLLVSFVMFTLLSCEQQEKKPDYLWEKEKFIEVLTDFQTAESIGRLGINRTKDSLIYNDSIYASVFRKHATTKAVFDSNFTYFSNKPQEFEKIFEEVITNLSTRSAALKGKEVESTEAVEN